MNDQEGMATEADIETFWQSYDAAGGRASELSLAALRCALDAVLITRCLSKRDVVRTVPLVQVVGRGLRENVRGPEWLEPDTSVGPPEHEGTERTGFAPGELEVLWSIVLDPNQPSAVFFGLLDFCPIHQCPTNGQSHEHRVDEVRRRLMSAYPRYRPPAPE